MSKISTLFAMLVLIAAGTHATVEGVELRITYSKAVRSEPFSGRVVVLFSEKESEPRFGPSWFRPEKLISLDVQDWDPGEQLVIDSENPGKVDAFPEPFEKMDLKGYNAQVVVRFNPLVRRVGRGAGNGYSEVVSLNDETLDNPVEFVVDQLVPAREFAESKWTKQLTVRSQLLSTFHGRDVEMHASVTLPESYFQDENRRFPVIYSIPGFGGTHHSRPRKQPISENNHDGVEFLRVTLDPSCPLGHHVFADSANNGPVGKALIEELIPALDRQYRTIPEPRARFLRGHSSGGWSSLWLQVTYPEFFGGTWSTAPDPVDFRDFQKIDIYQTRQNVYRDEQNNPRPLARRNGRVALTFESFDAVEWALGHGGQLHSFEAVFSPRGDDDKPMLLWDRETGRVNPEVAQAWKKYDIRRILERNWSELQPKLRGKIHVVMGGLDTFYLDGATRLLKESLAKLSDDPVVEIHEGKTHGSVMTNKLRDRIYMEMIDSFLTSYPGERRLVATHCEGNYKHHLQGVCADNQGSLYWSFTTELVKTDRRGKLLKKVPVADHHGDLCYHDGNIYAAVNLGKFNDPAGHADSQVFVYDAASLDLQAKHQVPEVIHGAGAIEIRDNRFYVVGGLLEGVSENYVYEYADKFNFVRKHVLNSGWTKMGIQTAIFHNDSWWFGCYGSPPVLLKADSQFEMQGRFEFDCSLGLVGIASDRLLVATGSRNETARHQGSLHVALPDKAHGLRRLGTDSSN